MNFMISEPETNTRHNIETKSVIKPQRFTFPVISVLFLPAIAILPNRLQSKPFEDSSL